MQGQKNRAQFHQQRLSRTLSQQLEAIHKAERALAKLSGFSMREIVIR